MEKKRKEPIKKEEVSEIFEVEKQGKEKIIETHAKEETGKQGSFVKAEQEEKAPSESQLKKEKKTFMTIILVMIGLVLIFLATYIVINYTKNFQYNGVNFYVDKEDVKGITLYRTSLPVIVNGTKANYNFYLRTDPRTLNDVTFDGNLTITHNMVINMTNDFNCNGNGVIAVANLVNLYKIIGADVIKDENATCSPVGQYTFLRIENGNETKIEQFGPSCYTISINNCEILEGTEKFMIETFSKVDNAIKG
jgi:hypothetical protein